MLKNITYYKELKNSFETQIKNLQLNIKILLEACEGSNNLEKKVRFQFNTKKSIGFFDFEYDNISTLVSIFNNDIKTLNRKIHYVNSEILRLETSTNIPDPQYYLYQEICESKNLIKSKTKTWEKSITWLINLATDYEYDNGHNSKIEPPVISLNKKGGIEFLWENDDKKFLVKFNKEADCGEYSIFSKEFSKFICEGKFVPDEFIAPATKLLEVFYSLR